MSCDTVSGRALPHTEPPFTVQATQCPSCRGEMLLFIGQFVSWVECLACQHSGVVGWCSCQPDLIGDRGGAPPVPGWVMESPAARDGI